MATTASSKKVLKKKGVTRAALPAARRGTAARPRIGQRIIEGLEQAVAWTQGRKEGAQVTVVQVPQTDVREVRRRMGLSQSRFAAKFGFPLATLQNWEQGRARPDAPTRVLLAVIARHPEAVEDVLGKAS